MREDHVDLESESPISSFDDLMDYESCQMFSDVSSDKKESQKLIACFTCLFQLRRISSLKL